MNLISINGIVLVRIFLDGIFIVVNVEKVINMKIWLDDLRDPKDYGQPDAVWFKSFSELKNHALPQGTVLLKNSLFINRVEEVHLDHDLGKDEDGTGYDMLLLIEEALHYRYLPLLKTIYIHTSNPSAGDKMMSVKVIFKQKYGVDVIRNNY